MTISGASLSHALHGITQHHPRPSATRAQPFAQLLSAAQSSGSDSNKPAPQSARSGDLLSADMLQAVQTIR